MWLQLDMALDDLTDDGQIAQLKADLELVLDLHSSGIIKPDVGLPMTSTGIVHNWAWKQ